MGSELSHRLRQVPRHATRQPSHRRSPPGGIFPQRWADAGLGEGETLAAAQPVDESVGSQAPGVESTLRTQPESVQSLHPQREPGPAVELSLRGRDDELSATLDRSTPMAACGAISETG